MPARRASSAKGRSSTASTADSQTPSKSAPTNQGSARKRSRASEEGHVAGPTRGGKKSASGDEVAERIVATLNDSTGTQRLTADGKGMNEPFNDMGETYLHWAAFNGHTEAVRWLVDRGADCGAKDKLGKTPLCRCVNGDSQCVQILLGANADVNHQDSEGVTPLHRASLAQSVANVQLLLKAGAQPNIRAHDSGHTPLHDACFGGSVKCVQHLISYGAVVKMPVEGSKKNDGAQALHFAAQQGNNEVVQLLLSKGADVNAKDVRGCVALHYAAYTCSKDVVMSLMQHRADVTIMNVDGETPHDITGKSRLAPRGVANEISALLLGKEPVPQKKGGCTVC